MLNFLVLISTILLFISVFQGVKSDLISQDSSGFSATFQAFCLTLITVSGLAIVVLMLSQVIK
jgi:hypothetical protein